MLQVQAVIVGHDRNINYYKIQYATLCIRENPGCQFIATNLDAVTHLTDAQEWAGNGAMVGAIKGMLPLTISPSQLIQIDCSLSTLPKHETLSGRGLVTKNHAAQCLGSRRSCSSCRGLA